MARLPSIRWFVTNRHGMGTERGGVSGEKLNRQLCFQDPVLMAKEYLYPDKDLD